MRIGINCFLMNDRMGGLRQYAQRLIRELLDHDTDNSYVIFHSPDNLHEIQLIGSERLPEAALQVSSFGELFTHLESLDVYFCPFAILWPRPLPVASVVNLSDIQEVLYPQFFSEQELDSRKRHFAPSTKCANSVLTVSEFSKRTIAEHHGITPEKIFVAWHSADESMFEPPAADALQSFDLPERFIFYPANFWQHKNHDALLRALVHLQTTHDVIIPCVLTGQEIENGYPIRKKIAEYGLDDQVRLLGYVTNEEVHALFHKAAILCFPSLYEGFGMPLVDAMAAGTPIVCSDVTSIPEVVENAALMFDPNNYEDIADKLLTLWNSESMREKLVAAGRERVKIFTAENMAKVHLQAFQNAFESFDHESQLFYRKEVWGPLNSLKELPTLQYQLINSAKNIEAIKSSFSWRITAPLRKFIGLLRGR